MHFKDSNPATASFHGSRLRLFAIILSGYILMFFTAGIYRFWLVTKKRRFYWSHTHIDGEALEYTGTALQLLIGFLLAIAIFLPLYGLFFYLSTQSPQTAMLGYSAAVAFMYFLFGYAAYRARRFLLSRTMWRGIRFQLSGNAWAYALKRFFWSIITVLTLGLAFPFMSASLWKYRYENTWFGDRKCRFSGSWKNIAALFYPYYFLLAAMIGAALYFNGNIYMSPEISFDPRPLGEEAISLLVFAAIVASSAYFHLRAHIASTMLSSVSIGRSRLKVNIKARSLFALQLIYTVLLALVAVGFLLLVGIIMGNVIEPMLSDNKTDITEITQLGWYNLAIFGLIYVGFMATITILWELVFGLGFWRIVARATIIENEADLRTIRASGEESPLAGEGIADALNVGAY